MKLLWLSASRPRKFGDALLEPTGDLGLPLRGGEAESNRCLLFCRWLEGWITQLLDNCWIVGMMEWMMLHCRFRFDIGVQATFSTWSLEATEPPSEKAETEKKELSELSEREMGLWEVPNVNFVEQLSGKLPEGNIQDMAFHFVESSQGEYQSFGRTNGLTGPRVKSNGPNWSLWNFSPKGRTWMPLIDIGCTVEPRHSLRCSLMCWTSCGLLWNLDMSGAEPEPQQPEAIFI